MTGSVLTAWPVRGPAPRSLSRGTGRPGRRTEWQQQSQPEPIEIARDVTHPARVYDYVRGGDDNFTADREVVDFAVAAGSGGFDHARAAVQANQVFHARAVTYLAGEAGIRAPGLGIAIAPRGD